MNAAWSIGDSVEPTQLFDAFRERSGCFHQELEDFPCTRMEEHVGIADTTSVGLVSRSLLSPADEHIVHDSAILWPSAFGCAVLSGVSCDLLHHTVDDLGDALLYALVNSGGELLVV